MSNRTRHRYADASDRPLRIAFLTPEFVTERRFDGGLANHLARVTRLLGEMGHQPEVFVTTPDVSAPVDLVHNGVLVHRLPEAPTRSETIARKISYRLTRRRYFHAWRCLLSARRLGRAFNSEHARFPYDIVQAADFMAGGLFISGRRVPVITRLSWFGPDYLDASATPPGVERHLYERLEMRAVRKSAAVFAPSAATAAAAARWFGRTVSVVHPPAVVDVGSDRDATGCLATLEPFALFFGRLSRLKGVLVLGEAIRMCLESSPGFRLVMAGREESPGILDDVKRVAGAAASRIHHVGRLPQSELFALIKQARFVVLPSLADNFPNAAVESMALAKPVIGTLETGFDDLIDDGSTGRLVVAGDPVALAAAMSDWWSLPDDRLVLLGARAAASLARFAPERMIADLLKLYAETIERHSRVCRNDDSTRHA